MLALINILLTFNCATELVQESYGIDLELLDFQSFQNESGFEANFGLNVDLNYSFFGLMRKGDKYNHDKLVVKLNNEYSRNSSQKKGSTFTIRKDFKMSHLHNGIYFFQLEAQDGNTYKSNQFSINPYGMWIIKRPTGEPRSKTTPQKITWLDKYKFYIAGAALLIFGCLIFLGIKAYKKQ